MTTQSSGSAHLAPIQRTPNSLLVVSKDGFGVSTYNASDSTASLPNLPWTVSQGGTGQTAYTPLALVQTTNSGTFTASNTTPTSLTIASGGTLTADNVTVNTTLSVPTTTNTVTPSVYTYNTAHTFTCDKVGKIVFCTLDNGSGLSTTAAAIAFTAMVPVGYRPAVNQFGSCLVLNNNTDTNGEFSVSTTGNMQFNPTGTTFTNAVLGGYYAQTLFWRTA